MELELSRMDYTLVGVTSKNCLKLLPNSKAGEQQKVVVADSDGILQVFSVKREDIQLQFKTLPGTKISSVHLGGELGTPDDKIFVCSGNEVRGFTKKGKLFLSFDSNMTEAITSMYVLGNDLFLCGNHIYNHYKDCKEIGSYLCGDCIVDVVALYLPKSYRLVSLIACEGRMIRAIEHARVTLSMEVESSPTVLHIYETEDFKYILFGTVDGRVGLLDLTKLQSFSRWVVSNEGFNSGISCIESYTLAATDTKNLILGRQDGCIEVYVVNMEDIRDVSKLLYSYNCNESITSLACGIVGNPDYNEIIVATYTGRIFSLTSQILEKTVQSAVGSQTYSVDTSQKIMKLRSEIEELQMKVARERDGYQALTQSIMGDFSAIPLLPIKDSMTLSKVDASYILSLEVPTAIDNVLLQSNVPVDLLNVEKNSAVVSHSDPEPQSGNFLLATYRCQINTNRLELKIRTIEGQYGTLQAYITPLLQPKFCQLRRYQIRPLSQHLRIYKFDENRCFNVLNLKGSFSLAEIHSWIYQCVPEVPERPHLAENTALYFQSTFLDTLLQCTFKKGEGEFKSDNISTISVLQEFLTGEATKKKIKLDISVSLNDESINRTLKLIHPKLQAYSELAQKISFVTALHELEVNNEDTCNLLSEKYKELLRQEKEIKELYTSQPSYLDRLYGIITDLYIDYNKFKGINAKSKLAKLTEVLESYTYENLLVFFRPELSSVL